MNYTQIIKAAKDFIMKTPATRLVLVWTLVISCILAWKAADIIHAVSGVAK